MSIRLKLLLSYIAMLVIPIALSILAAVIIGQVYLGDIMHDYRLDFRHDSVEKLVKEEALTFEEIKQVITDNPDKLMDVQYLNSLDKKVNVINTGIIVRKNDKNLYVSKSLNRPEILERLPAFGANREDFHGHDHDRGPAFIDGSLYSIQPFDFYFKDNSPGTLFMVSDVSPIGSFARNFLLTLILAVLLILIITNGLLTYIVSRSIIKPIEVLKNGAEQIKEGNLNFEVSSNSNDEIGQLCNAFEEMRCKLKESISLQMQYEENRKELISNISHDLKTPITAIKGYTEGIMDGVPDSPEKMEKYIQTIYSKAIDVDKMIDELFMFSKLDLKREPFNFESVEMTSYLEHCIEELQFDLNKKGIRLHLDMGKDKPVIAVADREKLKRVITNIIDNSVKYMNKDPGEINVKLLNDIDTITMEIRDNGRGIAEKDLALIFDRFYRADPSRNAAANGSGLGLAIARRIIEEHGGTMRVKSEENIGTSIFFTLKKGAMQD
ncbi:MAG: HAMP domain-containing sensor histidine kinase [Syntrophomonas sp.]